MCRPSPIKVWFWFPFLMLLCLIGCLLDSAFFQTMYGVNRGNRSLELKHGGGAIEATLYHETRMPPAGPVSFGGDRRSLGQFGIIRQYFPSLGWSGPDHPTPSKYCQLRIPHLFLIGVFLTAWLGAHRCWQRRKSRLLKLHAAPSL